MAWIICALLAIAVTALALRLIYLQKSIKRLTDSLYASLSVGLKEEIRPDTSDKHVRALVLAINKEINAIFELQISYASGDRELKEAVTNIAHDLRTPLAAIYGYLDLIAREDGNDSVKRYIAAIENRVTAMTRLTDELFGYSVIASTRTNEPIRTDIKRILEETLVSSYSMFEGSGISPDVSLPENSVLRTLDPDALSRVFGNIISNAAKYSEKDFSVVMTQDGEITFSNSASGLSEYEVSRLFDRFFTVDVSRRSTGLGLAIAKTLTLQMGGEIKAVYNNGVLSIILRF